MSRLHQRMRPKNSLDHFSFFPDSPVSLIVSQAAQTTCVQVNSGRFSHCTHNFVETSLHIHKTTNNIPARIQTLKPPRSPNLRKSTAHTKVAWHVTGPTLERLLPRAASPLRFAQPVFQPGGALTPRRSNPLSLFALPTCHREPGPIKIEKRP